MSLNPICRLLHEGEIYNLYNWYHGHVLAAFMIYTYMCIDRGRIHPTTHTLHMSLVYRSLRSVPSDPHLCWKYNKRSKIYNSKSLLFSQTSP
ncbi:hypothetical protein I7I53_06678 [Histoplasma capsulatum var. duboisii H88]|uniref:Uncharacterized protein n=1 Tax=Ajellomyces capsulatus (strain H88) TaxID=544711 RepID=A0A8A1LC87_AJEC8|nr:hypothetical protein I7I53_06678 [Histoplasma capsulatum var. duboisii H88]